MIILLKTLLLTFILGTIGLVVGPFAALLLMQPPAGACGCWAMIPIGTGCLVGGGVGIVLGLIFGPIL